MVMSALKYYISHPMEGLYRLPGDLTRIPAVLGDRQLFAWPNDLRPPCRYSPDPDWERLLHERLGAPWPCREGREVDELWPVVNGQLASEGYCVGPESFFGYNDADPELVRALWCVLRHTKPDKVVETGVSHGVTTRFILEAMAINGTGHLWSIDLVPVDPDVARQIGAATHGCSTERWTLLKGASRQRLPRLLADIAPIDVFIHDSHHSERNVRFEVSAAFSSLKPAGTIFVDDIDTNRAFHCLSDELSTGQSMVCQSRPLRPDRRRFDEKGLFGIILKQVTKPSARGVHGPVV